ncbi:phosphoribosyl transferase [Candidatus Kaiserbacteria bacterium]|nr:phosphoribosyl transferase [Candidatus Kaiserbacteria bacterium]
MLTDRKDAGEQLAKKLETYAGADVVVLALPRGGVVVGYEIARALSLPLDIVIVRKIGHPSNPECAVGAVGEDGTPLLSEEAAMVDQALLRAEIASERKEAKRRGAIYREGRSAPNVAGKTVIIADDGIATGLTMQLALRAVKTQKPKKVIVAVPVAPPDAFPVLKREGADETIVLEPPETFRGAVGAHYERFGQIQDAEVLRLLRAARRRQRFE